MSDNGERMWTRFMDMHSGGGQKLDWAYLYIEAPEAEAKSVFYARFGRNPERVTCTCCGEDYSIDSGPSLAQLTAYDRNCAYAYVDEEGREIQKEGYLSPRLADGTYAKGSYVERASDRGKLLSVEEYTALPTVHVITRDQIAPDELNRYVPAEGYVWAGDAS